MLAFSIEETANLHYPPAQDGFPQAGRTVPPALLDCHPSRSPPCRPGCERSGSSKPSKSGSSSRAQRLQLCTASNRLHSGGQVQAMETLRRPSRSLLLMMYHGSPPSDLAQGWLMGMTRESVLGSLGGAGATIDPFPSCGWRIPPASFTLCLKRANGRELVEIRGNPIGGTLIPPEDS